MKLSETGFKSTAALYSAYVAATEKVAALEPLVQAKESSLISFNDYKSDFQKRASIHDYEVKALLSELKSFAAFVQKKSQKVELPSFL